MFNFKEIALAAAIVLTLTWFVIDRQILHAIYEAATGW